MERNPVSCKLKISKDIDEKTGVCLVKFSNGNLNLNYSNKLKFSCYQNANASGTKRLLIANNGHLNYQGRSDEIKDDRSKFNYFIGVRSKTSKKMKVYNATHFNLNPVLKDNDHKSLVPEDRNFRERTDDLDMNFGSKGKKRAMAARQKYSMNSTALDDAIEDISLEDSVGDANNSLSFSSQPSDFDYLPLKNHYAQTADQVYNVNSIISSEEDKFVAKKAEELLNNFQTFLNNHTFCDYVLDHLKETGNSNRLKVKYLLYYDYLVIFSKLLSTDMKKKDPASQIPEPIRSCLLDRFTIFTESEYGKTSRNFPLKMKDKVLAYMVVLALIIDDYFVNLAQVQKGTKYSVKRVTNIAEALGCHIRRQKVNNCSVPFAELKLPLYVLHKRKK